MKKYLTPFNIALAVEILVIAFVSFGLIPREAVLFLTGLMVFYAIFSPPIETLCLLIISIPLFVAMPISQDFDTMANWRILIAVFFVFLLFKDKAFFKSLIDSAKKIFGKGGRVFSLQNLVIALFLMAALSILVASYKIVAVKKLIFLLNIFALFLIIRHLGNNKQAIIKIFKAAAGAGAIVIIVGLTQFFAVLFVPLYRFWQFWASKIILAQYGQNLSHLLSLSNTWFAYFEGQSPVLRLFSVFPDAHSLAMFSIVIAPIFFSLSLFYKDHKRVHRIFMALGFLAFFMIVLSGSRGAWMSFIPIFILALVFVWRKIEPSVTKKTALALSMFLVLFLLSSFYPLLLYKFESWQPGQSQEYSRSALGFFERAKSISDVTEISNKGRLEIWLASVKSIIKHPILGVGLGNYVIALDQDIAAAKKGASAHNLYLDVTTEIGIPGALIMVVVFIFVLSVCWRVFRKAEEPYFKMFGLLFGLYFLWVLSYSLFDVVLLNDKVFLLFMAGLGLLFGLKNLVDAKINE